MRISLLVAGLASVLLLSAPDRWQPPVGAAPLASTLLGGSSEFCLMPPEAAAATAAAQRNRGVPGISADWPPENVRGGNIQPVRRVFDHYPTFGGLAIDAEAGRAFFSDSSLAGLLSYTTDAGGHSDEVTEPATHVLGPNTGLGFTAGVAIDTERKVVYTVNNDGGGMVGFSYDASGPRAPVRHLETPHQAWGVAISIPRNEIAVSVQQMHAVTVYSRDALGLQAPLRTIRGHSTGLADPHGIDIDNERREIVVANHGNWTELRPYSPYDPLSKDPPSYEPGRFEPPSIRVFAAGADGNAKPIRTIVGEKAGLNWPMGLEIDAERDEIVVANYGDNSVRTFRRSASGNIEPLRVIQGDRTGIRGPVDVSIDRKRSELWVANYADHSAIVFERDASGNATPKRIVRNAPKGTPALTFTNASAAAYDTKRDALIVPN